MGVAGGPDIIENGLVLDLDASDRNSYVSGSTTWFDLSGNNNSGSLINGPTFNTGSLGSIVVDGVDDYVDLESSRTQILTLTSQVTFDLTFRMVQWVNSFYNGILVLARNPAPGGGRESYLLLYIEGDGSGKFTAQFGNSNGDAGTMVKSLSALSTNVIYNFTLTYNSGAIILYQNGSQIATGSNTTNTIYNTTQNKFFYGGDARYSPGTSGRYFNGNLYNLKIYNRVLSPLEVLQNYNATKARFGL